MRCDHDGDRWAHLAWLDSRFAAWRCGRCGHRVANLDETPLRATKTMPPRMWWWELAGRRWARRMDRQS